MKNTCNPTWFWPVIRLVLGWILLWAFLDKTFGLGYSTPAERAWTNGGSPTAGFLNNATQGKWLESVFQPLAESAAIEWLFMLGLLLIGTALILGIGLKIAGKAGVAFMFLLWLASIPPSTNPIIDDHIVYLLIFMALPCAEGVGKYSLQTWWTNTALVKKLPFLA